MNVKNTLRKSYFLRGAKKDLKQLRKPFQKIKRKKIIKRYLTITNIKKLQIGSNISNIDGWLATDLVPTTKNCIMLDATKRFPFNNNTFDYVYSEHMIEHISWEQGQFMLKECFRILKPGGKIRIATPDMEKYLNLYFNELKPEDQKIIQFCTDRFIKGISEYKPSFVINTIFRNWRHQFLYDRDLLELAFFKAGFVNMNNCEYSNSDDNNLQGLEKHGQNIGNENFAIYETLILEATKPSI